ncbi:MULTISPECIES: type I-E CRISPR-associated protein Cse2/CasB [Streptomyces]|uniref:CRISPR system Cascade subunit CasA n=1 Tax=Streptomyces harbinensis TaxID=1176198 RepID=A0A1I6VHH3_9ACTN|nr:type I-E CRISPR-associated protein Cse2/CasB [Streptomyces harbinensis]SFT13110.1 CRISPR system Cascade subunit CasA [Streptomyces harbinensis]
MTEPMEPTEPVPEYQGGEQLTAWLTSLVRNREYGKLADLRRLRPTDTHIRAGWYAPAEKQREIYEKVAFLFGVYHQGRSVPSYGTGSLGAAARRIGDGTGRGPDNPGAQRLLARLVASRRIPWRHLQHAVTRLRSCEQPPPSWVLLTEDLTRWHDRRARIAYGWSVDFHEPHVRSRNRPSRPQTRKDMST